MIRNKLPLNWLYIYDAIKFEFKTSFGRLSQKFHPLPEKDYLHVGCGANILEGFINSDVFSNEKADFFIDLRFPLPFPDSSFKGIYAHHVVEHLTYFDARLFFSEARRILKKDGIFRVVVPDAEKFIKNYVKNPIEFSHIASLVPEWHRSPNWKSSLEVVDYIFRDSYFNPHRSSWDFITLDIRLKESGFNKIVQLECGFSNDAVLCNLDNSNWNDQSIYVEASF